MHRNSTIVSTKQERIAALARQSPQMAFTSLAYLMDLDWLKEAYRRTRKDGAAGVDGVTAEEYECDLEGNLRRLLDRAKSGTYQAPPVRRVHIPKGGSTTETRPLGIPTMRDRAMQALYLLALDPIAETTADPNSYGFRKERSTADAIEQCHTVLSNRGGARWIFEGDIKSCFDRISHEWLLAHIPMDKTILRKWLKAGFMEKQVLHATEEGTPQGGICSPVLANLTLDGLERRLRERYPKATALSRKAKVNLVRYADDCAPGHVCSR